MSVERRALAVLVGCVVLAAILAATVEAATPASAVRAGRRARVAALPGAGPSIEMMIVGAGNVSLMQPVDMTVPSWTVETSRGVCGVEEGTPLAALADAHRAGGPAFAVRDYGHCTSSPRNSGQLFVYSLDGETNHGQDGWEYKVDNRSGTTGAGDPSGPFGTGARLRNGDELVWFWCAAVGSGCERTLGISAPASVAPGARMTVSVLGYDNEGRGSAMSGARVSIGGTAAVTGSAGTVTFRMPSRAALYTVRATRPGSVPSFPAVVRVR